MAKLQEVILRDTLANRPAASKAGRVFYDTTNSQLQRDNGSSWDAIEGAGGATDHGALTGLADDDHPQYHTPAEHTATDHTGLPGVGGGSVSDALKAMAVSGGGYHDFIAGRYYSAGRGDSNLGGSATLTLNRLYHVPFYCPFAHTFDRLSTYVSTAQAGGGARLGIYNSGANGLPSTVLLDAGTVDCSTTGAKEIVISQALAADTKFWLSMVTNNSSIVILGQAGGRPHMGAPAIGSNADFNIWEAHTYGALPTSSGTFTYVGVAATYPYLTLRA